MPVNGSSSSDAASRLLHVCGVQLGPYAGSYEAQMKAIEAQVERAAARKPHIICLPELMTTPYFPAVEREEYFRQAEEVPGPTTERVCGWARRHGVAIVGTLFERRGDRYFNTSFVADPSGQIIDVYRKTHIPRLDVPGTFANEKFYFHPGDGMSTFEVAGVRAAVLICYDRSFPEAWRVVTLRGAQVVFVPASSCGFRGDAFVEELRIRAMENGVFVVAVNKGGQEPMPEGAVNRYYGKTCLIGPAGDVREQLDDRPEAMVFGTFDLADVERARLRLPYLRDRRPDLYGELARVQG